MHPRSSSPICERSLDLTLIGIGRRDIPQCSPKHFLMQMFYRTFSGGQRPSVPICIIPWPIAPPHLRPLLDVLLLNFSNLILLLSIWRKEFLRCLVDARPSKPALNDFFN